MSLFQNTVLSKYLNTQDPELLSQKWEEFSSHFHDPVIQENIRNSKEEQYQEGFLRDLFVKVLGYTLNPTPEFNLTTEYKNVKDAKKADGAVIIGEDVPAVIELKGTGTTDLGTVEDQAFGYKNNQPTCKYVVISNFEKLRFYIDNAIEHIEFNLFNLTKEEFNLLYLCLAYENIKNDTASKIKNESLSKEDEITKQLYKDYSVFKRELFQNLTAQNPEYNQVELFNKSQKLLDRFLFLFFGEDRGLLPPNSVRMILDQWSKLKELDAYTPLYERFKKYFGYLNTGFEGKHYDVFAYNGGLFKPDEILDNTKIDDHLLYTHTLKLSEYDFESEVDVNILGHIFEHSLNEIDEIKAQLAGEEIDKTQTKRKKDGVFYTPKYITKYIVENTVGKLCEEEKAKLGIKEEDYYTDKKRQLKTKQKLLKKLQDYRKWLHEITIIDPACGSGSFLIEALNFLIEEHSYIDEMEAKLTDSAIAFSYHSESILENNLYGVDINEESVEIAKLSLWLRTAEPNRKLSSLSHNLKCGNSLIDDPEVAGDLAFNWEKEFPKIFKEKNAYHLVFTTHNSRISERMKKLKIKPGKPANLNLEQEIKLAEIFGKIIKDYDFDVLAWNVCKDHVHLVLVCTEDELTDQVRTMKSISAKELNRWINPALVPKARPPMGFSDASHATESPMGLDPLSGDSDASADSEPDILYDEFPDVHSPMGLDPLPDDPSPNDAEEARHRDALEGDGDALEDFDPYHPEEHNNHLWSQKFYFVDTESWKWISDVESGFPYKITHLTNALEYVENNRYKHQLPKSKELEEIIASFIKTPEEVFENPYKGGFDVVIGNPPYVKLETIKKESEKLQKSGYQTYDRRGDLYVLFVERGFSILKEGGLISYIMPNKWMQAGYGEKLRSYFLEKRLIQLIDFGDIQIFDGATTYPIIFIAGKQEPDESFEAALLTRDKIYDFEYNIESNSDTFFTKDFSKKTWVISSLKDKELLEKLKNKFPTLKEFVNGEANYGIKSGLTDAFIIDENTKNEIIKTDSNSEELIKPLVRGRDISRYYGEHKKYYQVCTFPSLSINIDDYTGVKNHLLSFGQERLEQSGKKGSRKKTNNKWFETQDTIVYHLDFEKPKIMYQVFQVLPCFIYDEQSLYCNNSMWILPTTNKGLLAILNSKMGWWLITKYCTQIQNGYQLIWKYFGEIPIAKPSIELSEKAEKMLSLNKDLQEVSDKFKRTLHRKFELEKLSKKLEDWYHLSFGEFIKELKKKKIKLSLSEEAEWEDYFLEEQAKALSIQSEIDATDKEIDQMVYQLYGLTEEEIEVVEKG